MGHRIFHRNNPLKSKICTKFKDGWILGQTYGCQTKGHQESSLGELKTTGIVVLMGLISNGKNVVVEKMSKMLKAPYNQQVFN